MTFSNSIWNKMMKKLNNIGFMQISAVFKTRYQEVLKLPIWLKTTFSNSIWIKMMKKLNKAAFMQISTVFETR